MRKRVKRPAGRRSRRHCGGPRGIGLCILALALAGLALGACGPGEEEPESPPAAELAVLHWSPMPSAEGYTVRAWSGYTLLFEQVASDTTLQLTPNLRSTLAAFDSVTVEVRGWRAAEPERALQVRRWQLLR